MFGRGVRTPMRATVAVAVVAGVGAWFLSDRSAANAASSAPSSTTTVATRIEKTVLAAPRPDDRSPISDRLGFSLGFNGEESAYRLMSTFVLPGEELTLHVTAPGAEAFAAEADGGELRATGPSAWRWTAPRATGVRSITIRRAATGETMSLNAFVLVPNRGQEALNGYRIGRYQSRPLRGLESYLPPRGFIEVTPANNDIQLSPHFRLSDFACKQPGGFPRYMVVRERMLLNLERVLERLNENGVRAERFGFISGFRTPYYNASIGNDTIFSRHGYGDAADVFVDNDRDGMMDDLDNDGRITSADARVIYDVVERLQAEESCFVGGLGLYGPKPSRGPFVHIDTRGYRARW